MKRILTAAIIGALGALNVSIDVQATSHAQAKAATSSTLADGEIRKVDKEAKKMTIRHGPLPGLDMPAMTMVFQVKDPSMLDQVKVGDKIRFEAEKIGGAYTVTHLEPAR